MGSDCQGSVCKGECQYGGVSVRGSVCNGERL